jgi:hypothetical protein
MPTQNRSAHAALSVLVILQLVMLSSLYAGIPPHPPVATPLFGIAPFIAAALSAAAGAMIIGPLSGKAGRGLGALAALMALVSFGPQKYLDAQFALIWPAVLAGQIAAIVLFVQIARSSRTKSAAPVVDAAE